MSDHATPPNDVSAADPGRDLDSIRALYRAGDEAGAFLGFERLAELGSAPAMGWLGYMYFSGCGTAPDMAAARQWYLKAAEGGNLDAMTRLGGMYRSGNGVDIDLAAARHWYSRAAEAGHADAMCWIGYMYFSGDGAAPDMAAARQWYLKAAEGGDLDAMTRLGRMYESGTGGATDLAAARHWYSKAAVAGDADGQYCLALLLDEAGERKDAERWLQNAADQDYPHAVAHVADKRAYQLMKEKHFAEAFSILEKTSEAGSAWAHACLGSMYWNGRGVPRDHDQSFRHYEAAYRGGEHAAANDLGRLHFSEGQPVVALEWLRKDTHRPISSLYWRYRIVKAHPYLESYPGEVDELLKEAAAAGHVFAKSDLAFQMMKGRRQFGTRLQGLRLWLRNPLQALPLIWADEHNERLR